MKYCPANCQGKIQFDKAKHKEHTVHLSILCSEKHAHIVSRVPNEAFRSLHLQDIYDWAQLSHMEKASGLNPSVQIQCFVILLGEVTGKCIDRLLSYQSFKEMIC